MIHRSQDQRQLGNIRLLMRRDSEPCALKRTAADSKNCPASLMVLLVAGFSALSPISALLAMPPTSQSNFLEAGWNNPPTDARLRAYWWWLNGNVTTQSITRDLEAMKAKGFGGAVLIDANGAAQEGNARVPHGPTFFSPEWRALYKHALHEAARLGLQMSLNIQSGWNLGGPVVTASDAAKSLVWSECRTNGPRHVGAVLPLPRSRDSYYRDTFVLAYRIRDYQPPHRPIENWAEKALYEPLHPFSAPITEPLFQEFSMIAGEEDTTSKEVVDLTDKLDAGGTLHWDVPAGNWQILRFGCTVGPNARVSTSSEGWQGYALDVFDAGAFTRYWEAIVEPLLVDAGPLAGTTLKYLHTDSWEIEGINWTPSLPSEFQQRFGYRLSPFLPVRAGCIVYNRDISDRCLADFRKTLGELTIAHHYKLFRDYAHRYGVLIHPESGGPHAVPIDAQRDLGWDDAPMSEFWAWSWEHRVGDSNRFFIKQPASAAHTYGHRLVLGEGFTSIGPHWQSRLADNLKPSFDQALCEGLNLLVWHAFVCSPASMGIPGQQYFAGTHLNPNDTWWPMSAPFFAYINRCQFLLQRGLPVSDALYYYGDHVPNFTQLRRSDPAHVVPGYDYDVITEEAILSRVSVKRGRFVLPDGVSYAVLMIPDHKAISLPVLRKLKELVLQGGIVIGPKPVEASGLKDYPECDREAQRIASQVWGADAVTNGEHIFGKGRVLVGQTAREALSELGIGPDFESAGASPGSQLDYIHRRDGDREIYFLSSRAKQPQSFRCTFRVAGKQPELWDPVSGAHRLARAWSETEGRTTLPLDFAACGSIFVIFQHPAAAPAQPQASNSPALSTLQSLAGPWNVAFDPKWGGPASTTFEQLESWTACPEPGVKYYSGTAVYRKTFILSSERAGKHIWLDLGDVRELAQVKLNGQTLGIVWTPPYRVDATRALRPGENQLEVEVVNFWCNRIIGDQFLPPEQRFTRTNIRKLTRLSPLMDSGLLGPVHLLQGQ